MKMPVTELPMLFKANRFWSAIITSVKSMAVIKVRFGVVGSANIQELTEEVTRGKNIGRSNETTPFEQAVAETTSKWNKKKDLGYSEEGVTTEVAAPPLPMLAQKFEEKRVCFPAITQPKLDGLRCIAIIDHGQVTLWTRRGKPIVTVPHVVAALSHIRGKVILDGELYSHDIEFEKLMGLISAKVNVVDTQSVVFNVFDLIDTEMTYEQRHDSLCKLLDDAKHPIALVESELVDTMEDLMVVNAKHLKEGYEGTIVRNLSGMYKLDHRSYDLLKLKAFTDDEFEIIGIEEGSGKLKGTVGAFVCKMKDGATFKAKPMGTIETTRRYFEDHSTWEGKMLTVAYFETTRFGIPRHPVGKAIRDYE